MRHRTGTRLFKMPGSGFIVFIATSALLLAAGMAVLLTAGGASGPDAPPPELPVFGGAGLPAVSTPAHTAMHPERRAWQQDTSGAPADGDVEAPADPLPVVRQEGGGGQAGAGRDGVPAAPARDARPAGDEEA
ncbi:MAG: hypothetical protein LBG06_12195, partial [Deltaproteobacteria bacterium]|nr:hypothetical protein [Deltaproteobacteria bacterium]